MTDNTESADRNPDEDQTAGTQLQVTYDERGIALWIRPQLDVPIVMSAENAAQLAADLQRGIADREQLSHRGG